jgi:hypothetical protein
MFRNVVLVVAVAMVLSFSVYAFADFEVHMVDALGKNLTTDFRDGGDFQLSETPYLYFNVEDLKKYTFGGSYWTDPVNELELTAPALVTGNDVWYTLDWTSVAKTPGTWTVEGWYKSAGINNYTSDTVTFNYVPEPVSTALFLLGGATLAVRRIRKNK